MPLKIKRVVVVSFICGRKRNIVEKNKQFVQVDSLILCCKICSGEWVGAIIVSLS